MLHTNCEATQLSVNREVKTRVFPNCNLTRDGKDRQRWQTLFMKRKITRAEKRAGFSNAHDPSYQSLLHLNLNCQICFGYDLKFKTLFAELFSSVMGVGKE